MIEIENDSLFTDVPEVAAELAKRVVGGLLTAARVYAPSQENAEGKKVHVDLPVLDGVLYVGPELGTCVTTVSFDLAELCKKKSPLRGALAEVGRSLRTRINYTEHGKWLKIHEKNVRSASLGATGIGLVVAPGIAELGLELTDAEVERVSALRALLDKRTSEDRRLGSDVGVNLSGVEAGTVVLCIGDDGIELGDTLERNYGGLAQVRVKPAMFPKVPLTVRVYEMDDSSRLLRFSSSPGHTHVEQFIRVLRV